MMSVDAGKAGTVFGTEKVSGSSGTTFIRFFSQEFCCEAIMQEGF